VPVPEPRLAKPQGGSVVDDGGGGAIREPGQQWRPDPVAVPERAVPAGVDAVARRVSMGRARSGWPFASSPGLREIPHGLWDFTYRLVRYVDIGGGCDAKSLNKHMLIFGMGIA